MAGARGAGGQGGCPGKSTVRKSDHGLLSAQRYTGRQHGFSSSRTLGSRAERALCARPLAVAHLAFRRPSVNGAIAGHAAPVKIGARPRIARHAAAMPDDGPDEEVDDLEEEPQLDTSFKQTIVVDGLPVVPEEKHEKLLNLLRKFFSQVSARLATEGGRLA